MSSINTFLITALLLPIGVALINYVWPAQPIRRFLLIVLAAVLAGSAVWLHLTIGLEPIRLDLAGYDRLVFAADLILLAYFLSVSIRRGHQPLMLINLLQLAVLIYLELVVHPKTAGLYTLTIDRLSVVMYLIAAGVGSIILLFTLCYMDERADHTKPMDSRPFFFWFTVFFAAMNGIIFSDNLFWLYFFWEATTLCSFQLIGFEDTEEARRSAMRALFFNSIGGLAFAGALILLLTQVGTGAVSLYNLVNSDLETISTPFLTAVALLALAGFTKAALFPFQNWLLGAMVAPTPVSALLHSSTMVKAGVYLVIRLAPAYTAVLLSSAIALAGAVTFFAASLLAFREENAKRVLAYSTVANLGLIVVCAGTNTPLALNAAILLMLFHALTKALLFLTTGAIEQRIGSRSIENMAGLVGRVPGLAYFLIFGALAMFLPPFGMLIGKWAFFETAIREPLLLPFFVAGSTLTVLFWTKWIGRLLSAPPGAAEESGNQISRWYQLPLAALGMLIIAGSLGCEAVTQRLSVPALIMWYPSPLVDLPGLNLGAFAWVPFFNPALHVGQSPYYEGIFPIGLLIAAVAATLFLPWIAGRVQPDRRTDSVYLGGANAENEPAGVYLSAGEQPSQVRLGGYYFPARLNRRLDFWLSLAGLGAIAVMMGVVNV
ncbi:MAG: NADH-quinone oxidoreductase subunit L [Solirubrobacterales bacterium]